MNIKNKIIQGDWQFYGELDNLTIEAVQNKGTDDEYYKRVCTVACYENHTPNYVESEATAKLLIEAKNMYELIEKLSSDDLNVNDIISIVEKAKEINSRIITEVHKTINNH